MTAIVDHVSYNDLPSLAEANISRQAPQIDAIINGPIRDVFLRHGAHGLFCLYLQHRHHSVGQDEAVVKMEGTAHLMTKQAMDSIISFGNKVVATTWMTSGDRVLPMEYTAVPTVTTVPSPPAAFLAEFISVLASNECSGVFGIDTIAKNAWAEIKVGDASVVVPSNESTSYDEDKFIPVAFAFGDDDPKFKVHGKCGKDHKHTSKPAHLPHLSLPELIMYYKDPWPVMPDGTKFDGKQLLGLVRSGKSPFDGAWDVNLLIQELEENLGAAVTDIPFVYSGSNNYGFHVRLSNHPDVVARLARGDVNMPDYDGFPIQVQIPEVKFEAAVYKLLDSEPSISCSRLLYYRAPRQHAGLRHDRPGDILGRRLMVFRRAEGENNVWYDLTAEQKVGLLTQSARIRASLFNFQLPLDFAAAWLRDRLFEQKPESLPIPVAPTREFCVALFTAKIEATIRNEGDMIGWEDDDNTVGPVAAAAKQSLLRLIPHMMPADSASLYRLVLDHGDFGIHNMSITIDAGGKPLVTSLYDWETGCIMPAILSDPLMAVSVDLVADKNGRPSITRVPSDGNAGERVEYMECATHYFEVLFKQAPDYKSAIRAGKDARHLWFALRDWRGADPESYFGKLGSWAERRMRELGV
ncbi:hypothetical protein MY5147_009653 [Beauveria neobassiana]